jgi:serine/threonine-protein kinase
VAPEVLLGHSVDHRADLFSMGVAIYYAMTGVHPFRGGSVEETLDNVLGRAVDPPSSVGLRSPPAFDWIVMQALEKNPEERFSSAEEMLVNLRRVAARQDLMASPSEVAGWVRTALAPLLQARRAAAIDAPSPRGFSELAPTAQPFESGPSSYSSPEKTVALFDGKRESVKRSTWLTLGFVVLCLAALIATLLGTSHPEVRRDRPPEERRPASENAPAPESDGEEVVIPELAAPQ